MRSGLVSMIHSNANVLNARPARQQLRACTTSVFGQKLKELLRNVYFLGRRLKDTVVTLRHMDMNYGSNNVIRAMRFTCNARKVFLPQLLIHFRSLPSMMTLLTRWTPCTHGRPKKHGSLSIAKRT